MKTKTLGRCDSKPRGRRKLGRPRLLIIGCGDIGLRIVARLKDRFHIVALTSSKERITELRAAGATAIVGNLDEFRTLARLSAFGERVLHLAPPARAGKSDPRTRRLIAALKRRRPAKSSRAVYVSTTGVYGDRGGNWIDETGGVQPVNDRAIRRVAAEQNMREALHATVLRVPGIYAGDRLPLDRLRQRLPALTAAEDVHSNHIHAEDLARAIIAALYRGRPARVINTVDDSELKMGEYFDLVADAHQLPRPPRLPRADLRGAVSPMMLSFMSESRRIRNHRMKRELRVRLLYPTVAAALAQDNQRQTPAD